MQIRIKKCLLVFISLITINILAGCSRLDFLNYIDGRDTKDFREMMDKIFASFDSCDTEGLKNLFSVNARKENPDLDNQIMSFFEVYKGPMEIEKIRYSTSGGEKVDFGKRRTELHNSYDIIISADGIRYYLFVELVSKDDFNKNNEGLQVLNIATEEAYNSKYFSYYWIDDKPGLYYQNSTEKRDDLEWIEGRSQRYQFYDRVLTADDLRSVVEKNDSFKNFVSVIGEPSCSWTNYAYYYYELENGLFAVCKVEDGINNVRPRVNGRVVRPDVIVAIYIADEEKNLETIWMANDIVKIAGDYRYFLPIDRELSEEYFKTFTSRSSSLSELKEEIGLPNIDETWRCFYKISDNRFVVCDFLGDNIHEFSVADSEGRVYTIWEAPEEVD